MSSRRMQSSVSSVVAQHASEKLPTISLLGYALAGDGLARVVVEVAHNRSSRENHELVASAMSKLFENKLQAVCGSFKSVDKAPYTERVEGVVRVNTQVVPMEAASSFRSVSANIFMDDEDKMWVLRKTESGDILVKNTGIEDHESLKGLLDVACSSGYSLSSEFQKATASVVNMQKHIDGGSYIQYVSNASGETRFGFVVATTDEDKLLVLPKADDAAAVDLEPEVVERAAVVQSYDTEQFPEVEMSEQEQMDIAVSTSRGVVNVETLLSFYQKVFARSGKYFDEFAKRVRGHAFM